MIDLKKAVMPETVEVSGILYPVHTSFKYWLRFLECCAEKGSVPADFDFMYKDLEVVPPDRNAGFEALKAFCNPPQQLPRYDGNEETVIDYAIDADYIYSAFMEQYGIDLVASRMHWYKFQALFRGLHDTKLNEIIGYRMWEDHGRKRDEYTRQMEKLKKAWELPESVEITEEDEEALKAFEEWWNKGKKS